MREYETGYILPHLSEYVGKDGNGQFIHGKLGGELAPISKEEAAKRVMYNFYEENAWNIEGTSVIAQHPKTPSEIAMNHFAEEIGFDVLEEALYWCQEISYKVIKEKKELFESVLRQTTVLESHSRTI